MNDSRKNISVSESRIIVLKKAAIDNYFNRTKEQIQSFKKPYLHYLCLLNDMEKNEENLHGNEFLYSGNKNKKLPEGPL